LPRLPHPTRGASPNPTSGDDGAAMSYLENRYGT